MLTYLHHSDPTIPHYRKKEWTFLRGALATVDRPLLGWVGRYFLHNVSHDHVSLVFCCKCIFCLESTSDDVVTPLSVEDFSLINIPTYRSPITPTQRYRSVSFYTKFKKSGTLVLTTSLFLDDILNDIIITHLYLRHHQYCIETRKPQK